MNDLLIAVILFFTGIIVSFINIMAGGGSVLSLGIMMLLGLDPVLANGTNRVGILSGGLSGAVAYQSEKFGSIKESLKLSLAAIPGAMLGAFYAVRIDSLLFQRILALVMIFVILTLFLPKKKLAGSLQTNLETSVLLYVALFFIGFYGGFIQAGVGFFIMAAFRHITQLQLIKINLFKNHIVLLYTIPIIFIFGFSGKINWIYAVSLAGGNVIGAWISVKISLKKGDKVVKIVLAIAILLMAIKFLISS